MRDETRVLGQLPWLGPLDLGHSRVSRSSFSAVVARERLEALSSRSMLKEEASALGDRGRLADRTGEAAIIASFASFFLCVLSVCE